MKPVIDFVCRAEKGKFHELQKQLEELKQNLQTTRMELASCTTEMNNLKNDLKTSRDQYSSTISQLNICSQAKPELNENVLEKFENCSHCPKKAGYNWEKYAIKLQDDLTSLHMYMNAIVNCRKNTLTPYYQNSINQCMTTTFSDMLYPGGVVASRYAFDRMDRKRLLSLNNTISDVGLIAADYDIVTNFNGKCNPVKKRRNIFIAVFSAPANFEKREAIRKTWAKDLENVWNRSHTGFAGYTFILGKTEDKSTENQIFEEFQKFKDILQISQLDIYGSFPNKIFRLFEFLLNDCSDFEGFILKVDDNVYVNVRTLEYFIHSNDPLSQSIFGSRKERCK